MICPKQNGHNHKNGIKYKKLYKLKAKNTAPFVQWGYQKQEKVNTITKTASDTQQYNLKAKNTAPFVQWGYPKQSEHNHQKRLQIQDSI